MQRVNKTEYSWDFTTDGKADTVPSGYPKIVECDFIRLSKVTALTFGKEGRMSIQFFFVGDPRHSDFETCKHLLHRWLDQLACNNGFQRICPTRMGELSCFHTCEFDFRCREGETFSTRVMGLFLKLLELLKPTTATGKLPIPAIFMETYFRKGEIFIPYGQHLAEQFYGDRVKSS